MNILAFDTSSAACSAALYFEDKQANAHIISRHEIAPMQHTSIILPMMQSLLQEAGLTLAELNAIAFGCGPGSFTGIRIAASLAQGLAYANTLPVIPISSLAAAAQAAYMQHGWHEILTAVDARMGQIYWCAYQIENQLAVPLFAEELAAPEAIHSVSAGSWAGVGDGWKPYLPQISAVLGWKPQHLDAEAVPTAEAVLSLAIAEFKKGNWVDAADALPVYLR